MPSGCGFSGNGGNASKIYMNMMEFKVSVTLLNKFTPKIYMNMMVFKVSVIWSNFVSLFGLRSGCH